MALDYDRISRHLTGLAGGFSGRLDDVTSCIHDRVHHLTDPSIASSHPAMRHLAEQRDCVWAERKAGPPGR